MLDVPDWTAEDRERLAQAEVDRLEKKQRNKSAEVIVDTSGRETVPDYAVAEAERILKALEQQYGVKVTAKCEMYGENPKAPFTFIPSKDAKGNLHVELNINELFDWPDSLETFNNRIYKKNYLKGNLASQNMDDLIYHEYMHFLTFDKCRTWDEFLSEEKAVRRKFVLGVSNYADMTEDGAESIAEAAVRIRNGEDVDIKAKRMVETLLESVII